MSEPIEVVVEEATWHRGKGFAGSRLLNSQTMQRCCIGFAARACGISDARMSNKSTIQGIISRVCDIVSASPLCISRLYERQWLLNAYAINDDPTIDDEVRKQKLSNLGLENGIKFVFKP